MQLHVLWYVATVVASCAFTLVLTREARTAATRFGLVDVPDGGRRRHLRAVPRGGGIPLFISVGVTLSLLFLFAPPELKTPALASTPPMPVLVAGAVAVLLLGFVDDLRGLGARTKFFIEVVIAVALFVGGLRIHVLHVGSASIQFNTAVSLVVTVLWVVGITNAFNLIDGSDGVASGAAVFAALTMALVAALGGDGMGAAIALAIAGATFGFLFFNFPPASMFLGDSGSLFLGYSMAVLGIVTAQKATTMLAVAIPVVSCGFPIIDALLTIVRRFLRRQPIFASDRGHIHHRLQDLGQSPRQVALVLYAVSAAFALLSLLLVRPRGPAIAVYALAGVVVCLALQRLRIPELLELYRVIARGLHQREVIAYNLRVREAAELLGAAATAADVERALVHCFGVSEFERVELNWIGDGGRGYSIRVSEGSSWPTPVLRNGKGHGVGHAVARSATEVVGVPRVWEICLPFRDGHGQILGTLTLWAHTERVHLLMDLRLVARELQPLLQAALTRTTLAEEKRVPTSERRISAEVGIAQAS